MPFTNVPPLFPNTTLHLSSKRFLRLAGWVSIHSASLQMVITELVGQDSHIVNEAAPFVHKIHYFRSLLQDEKNCTVDSVNYNGNAG